MFSAPQRRETHLVWWRMLGVFVSRFFQNPELLGFEPKQWCLNQVRISFLHCTNLYSGYCCRIVLPVRCVEVLTPPPPTPAPVNVTTWRCVLIQWACLYKREFWRQKYTRRIHVRMEAEKGVMHFFDMYVNLLKGLKSLLLPAFCTPGMSFSRTCEPSIWNAIIKEDSIPVSQFLRRVGA